VLVVLLLGFFTCVFRFLRAAAIVTVVIRNANRNETTGFNGLVLGIGRSVVLGFICIVIVVVIVILRAGERLLVLGVIEFVIAVIVVLLLAVITAALTIGVF
jgi:hypothetical protein